MSSGPVALFVFRLANFLSMANGDSAMLLTQGTILVDVTRSDRYWGWCDIGAGVLIMDSYRYAWVNLSLFLQLN